MFGTLFYLTLYLQRVHGDSPVAAGASLLPLTVLSGLAGPGGGMLARRTQLRFLLCGGLVLACGGALGTASVWSGSGEAGLWPWLALLGTGIGLALTGGSQAVVGSAPAAQAAIATGIQQTSLNIGGALATAVRGIHAAFFVVAAVTGAAALAAVAFIRSPARHGQAGASRGDCHAEQRTWATITDRPEAELSASRHIKADSAGQEAHDAHRSRQLRYRIEAFISCREATAMCGAARQEPRRPPITSGWAAGACG